MQNTKSNQQTRPQQSTNSFRIEQINFLNILYYIIQFLTKIFSYKVQSQIEFEQYKIFNEIKNAQHIEINQYQTLMAILASNLKLSIYDAITRNQITEINIQDYVKIENSLKQSAYYKCGDVIMRFLKNSNYLSVYLKNYGDFIVIKINEPKNTKPVYRLQLQDKLSFIEMDPFSKNLFIFGQKNIELGNIKTQNIICIEEGQTQEVTIPNSSEDDDDEDDDFQSEQSDSNDVETKYPKSVSSHIPQKYNQTHLRSKILYINKNNPAKNIKEIHNFSDMNLKL